MNNIRLPEPEPIKEITVQPKIKPEQAFEPKKCNFLPNFPVKKCKIVTKEVL